MHNVLQGSVRITTQAPAPVLTDCPLLLCLRCSKEGEGVIFRSTYFYSNHSLPRLCLSYFAFDFRLSVWFFVIGCVILRWPVVFDSSSGCLNPR